MRITQITKELKAFRSEINALYESCLKRLEGKPVGTLSVYDKKGCNTYVHYDGQRHYLNSKQQQLIKELEEKTYYTALCKALVDDKEIAEKAERLLKKLKDPESVFLNIPKAKTHLIKPFAPLEKGFKRKIINKPFSPDAVFKTKAGEYVRSKSELIIADKLFDCGVSYCYEPNLLILETTMVNPDFLVMNKRTGETYYWEHFGMMDNSDYCKGAQIKLENYAQEGFFPGGRLLVTFESAARPLNTQYLDEFIKHYLL